MLTCHSILILFTDCDIITNMRKKYLTIFLLIAIVTLSSCKLIASMNINFGPTEIIVNQQFFSLQWDSSCNDLTDNQADTSTFRLHYRNHGTFKWYYLSDIPASKEGWFFISEEQLDYGVYDFAVSYINKEGIESELHTSLDASAKPMSGWYVNWYFQE